jgi:hypothetical protein
MEKKKKGQGITYIPDEDSRRRIAMMVACGIPTISIARIEGICRKTLIKYYRHELDNGVDIANMNVGQTLYKMAVSGKVPSATFFWLKTRAKWKENHDADVIDLPKMDIKVVRETE